MTKYRFITIIHNLEYPISDEFKIHSIGNISNNQELLNETFDNNLTIGTLGVHSIDEFLGCSYFYLDGVFKDKTQVEIDKIGVKFTFAILRIIQSFVFELWKIKDNNLYVRDGFLYVYDNEISDGYTYKASVSAISTFSNIEKVKSNFTLTELNKATESFQFKKIEDFYSEELDFKSPTDFHFFKNSKSSRIDRSWYFILSARNNGTIPMKILSYCTALECLFTSSKTELVHKIAERVSVLLEKEQKNRIELYNLIKKAYGIRSTVVHGSALKGESKDLVKISVEIDIVLRKLINGKFEIFYKNDNEINDYFTRKLFEN